MLHDPNEVRIFPRLPADAIEHLRELGEIVELEDGAVLFTEGDDSYDFWVVLEGEVRITKKVGGATTLLAVHHPGEFAGEISILTGGAAIATGHADGPVRALRVPSADFRRIVMENTPVAATILTAMTGRAQDVDAQLRQQEKLVALGQLSAGLAHELNNPAAAALRAVNTLRETLLSQQTGSLEYDSRFSAEQCQSLRGFYQEARTPAPVSSPPLDPLAQSEREERFTEWMEARKVPDAWDLAPTLVCAGFGEADFARLDAAFPGDVLAPALQWLASALTAFSVLEDIEHSTRRISDLVGAMRSYSYMDRGNLQEVDIARGLEDTLRILHHKLKDGIEVIRDYAPDIPSILAYGSELNQVWTNLLDNAIAAMKGKGRLTVRAFPDHEQVVVQIIDTGPGVPPAIKERIWEPFFTTKGVGEGTGLGLDIALRIICRRHGGSLQVQSEPGHTCFEARLYRQPPAESTSRESIENESESESSHVEMHPS